MRYRDVRISAIKRAGGKTTLYHPISPRLDPHDVTPQSYLTKRGKFNGRNTSALQLPGSKSYRKLKTGERYHKCTKHPPTSISTGYLSCHSMGQGGWVSKIVVSVPLRQNGIVINIFLFHVRVPYPEQMKRPSPRPAKH